MFSKIQFKHKIIMSFLIPITILVGSIIFTSFNIHEVRKLSLQIKNTDLTLASAASTMKFDSAEIQQWLTDVSATRAAPGFDDGPKKAEEYYQDLKKNLKLYEDYYTANKDTKNLERINSISKKFENFYEVGKKMSQLYIKDGPSAGNAFMEHFDKAAEDLDKDFTPFVDEQNARMKETITKNDDNINQTMLFLKIVLVTTFALSCYLVYFLYTSTTTINSQFVEIGRFASSLKDGDLNAKVNINTTDEVGVLAKSFNDTMNFIKEAFQLEKITWSEIADQKQRELQAQNKVKEALSLAEMDKAEAMEAKKLAEIEKNKTNDEKIKAEEAVKMAAEEKRKSEELAAKELAAAEELRKKVDRILNVVQYAKEGDLTKTIKIDGDDAIAKLSQSLDSFFDHIGNDLIMIDRFAKNLDQQSHTLNEKCNILGKNAYETNDLSNKMSEQTSKIVSNIHLLSSSTSELKQAVSEISRQANDTNKFSAESVKFVNMAKGLGDKLEENSNDISQFINVITAIARQTNLLALNATIEAARAGEAGRGFAVVANEVKELARQSAQAADEITNKVQTIKNNSLELTTSILKVNELMENINNASRVVASATEQQFATTDQFVDLIGHSVKEADQVGNGAAQVNQSALNTSEIVKENVAISKELSSTSDQLNSMVKKFKLKEGVAYSNLKIAA